MAKMRHLNRAWLQSAAPDVAQDYADFLLGEHCLNLDAVDVEGMRVARPSFKQVSLYDKKIPKAQAAYITGGLDYLAASRKAWSNDEIRARHLLTPLFVATAIAVAPRRRSRSPRADPDREWYKAQKNKGKGKNGIKSRSKCKEGKRGDRARGKGLKAVTPDGHQICFAWWTGEPCDGKCGGVIAHL